MGIRKGSVDLSTVSCELHLYPICHLFSSITQISQMNESEGPGLGSKKHNTLTALPCSHRVVFWQVWNTPTFNVLIQQSCSFHANYYACSKEIIPRGRRRKKAVRTSFAYRVVFFQILSCILLSIPSDFSDKDDAFCLGVLQEHLQAVYKVCPIKWITADALQEKKQTNIAWYSGLLKDNSWWYLRIIGHPVSKYFVAFNKRCRAIQPEHHTQPIILTNLYSSLQPWSGQAKSLYIWPWFVTLPLEMGWWKVRTPHLVKMHMSMKFH